MNNLRGPMQKFGIALFVACRQHIPEGNLLYSPLTASTGLFLLLLGSDGETREEIELSLEFKDSPLLILSTFEKDLVTAFRCDSKLRVFSFSENLTHVLGTQLP